MSLPLGRISCVVCAYNEAERIGRTLSAIVGHPLFGEIIVINDGSTDATEAQVRAYPDVSLVSYSPNQGKSYALAHGIIAARHEHLMLLDADLSGLSWQHIEALAEPVLAGAADMSISLRGNSLGLYRMIGLDFVSGERVVPRRLLLEAAETMTRLPKWASEVFINNLIIDRCHRIAIVDWPDVSHTPKHLKMGPWQAIFEDLRMMSDALRILTPFGVFRQNVALLRLARQSSILYRR